MLHNSSLYICILLGNFAVSLGGNFKFGISKFDHEIARNRETKTITIFALVLKIPKPIPDTKFEKWDLWNNLKAAWWNLEMLIRLVNIFCGISRNSQIFYNMYRGEIDNMSEKRQVTTMVWFHYLKFQFWNLEHQSKKISSSGFQF